MDQKKRNGNIVVIKFVHSIQTLFYERVNYSIKYWTVPLESRELLYYMRNMPGCAIFEQRTDWQRKFFLQKRVNDNESNDDDEDDQQNWIISAVSRPSLSLALLFFQASCCKENICCANRPYLQSKTELRRIQLDEIGPKAYHGASGSRYTVHVWSGLQRGRHLPIFMVKIHKILLSIDQARCGCLIIGS